MQINPYTRTVIRERRVANLVDESAIQQSGAYTKLAGSIADTISTKINDANDRTWLNETLIKKQKQDLDESYQERLTNTDNPRGFSGLFDKKVTERDAELEKTAPSDRARELFKSQAAEQNLSLYGKNKAWEFEATVQSFDNSVKRSSQAIKDTAYSMGLNDDDLDDDVYNQIDATTIAGSDIYSPEQLLTMNEGMRKEVTDSYVQGLIAKNPNKAYDVLKRGEYAAIPENSDFNYAVNAVFKEEGGYVADDAGAGPTIYGINSKANPKEFEDIIALQNEGKVTEAKALAKQVYKSNYWDAVGADKLDPKMAFIAMDSAVNMGVGATKKMLAEAGGDAYKFLDLRRERYKQIAQNPEKASSLKGWMGRVDRLEARLDGGLIPAERQVELSEKAQLEIRKNQVEYRQVLKQEMDVVEKTASLGVKIPEIKLNELAMKAQSNGLDDEYKAIQTFKKVQSSVVDFVKKPMAEQKTEFLAMQEVIKSGDVKKVNEFEAISKAFEQKIKAVNDSPLDYYASADVIKPVNPVDFANPQQMADEITNRRASIQLIKEKDGVSAPLLTAPEIDKIKEIYNTGKPKEVSNVIASIGANLNSDERRLLALKMKDAPILAAAMAQENPKVTERILSGSKIEKAKVGIDKIAPVIYGKLNSAITDPEALNSTVHSVYSYYKYLTLQAGLLDSEDVSDERLTESIKSVVGQVRSVTLFGNSSNVIIPQNMDENQFEDVFDSVDDAVLMETTKSAMFSNFGEALDTESALSLGVFRTVGDGKYSLLIDGEKVLDKNGNDYIFDVHKLKDTAAKMGRLRTVAQNTANLGQSFYNPVGGGF